MNSYDLQINQGTTFSMNMSLTDINGNPIDLTNANVSGFLKFRYGDTGILANLSVSKIDPYISGMVALNIAASGTQKLPITIGCYDINMYQSGIVTKVLGGNAYIYPDVTY